MEDTSRLKIAGVGTRPTTSAKLTREAQRMGQTVQSEARGKESPSRQGSPGGVNVGRPRSS
jgi:hypothetical protein